MKHEESRPTGRAGTQKTGDIAPRQSTPTPVDPRFIADTPDAAQWRARLAEKIWQQQRRKEAIRAFRRDMAARRAHGLAARHAAKRRR